MFWLLYIHVQITVSQSLCLGHCVLVTSQITGSSMELFLQELKTTTMEWTLSNLSAVTTGTPAWKQTQSCFVWKHWLQREMSADQPLTAEAQVSWEATTMKLNWIHVLFKQPQNTNMTFEPGRIPSALNKLWNNEFSWFTWQYCPLHSEVHCDQLMCCHAVTRFVHFHNRKWCLSSLNLKVFEGKMFKFLGLLNFGLHCTKKAISQSANIWQRKYCFHVIYFSKICTLFSGKEFGRL